MANHSMIARYELERVEIICPNCNDTASSFYRKPILESDPTKADKFIIGQSVQVSRFVAWVGYAKTPGTVFWSEKDEQEVMSAILMKVTGIDIDTANSALHFSGGHYWLENATRKRARYLLHSEAFRSKPVLVNRGLWFMDMNAIVKIEGVLRCITGVYSRYTRSGYWDDGGETSMLDGQVHHQLFYGCDKQYNRIMIYPDDIEGGDSR